MATVKNLNSGVPIIQCAKCCPGTIISLKLVMTVLTALESSFTTDKDRSKDIQSDLELRSYYAIY